MDEEETELKRQQQRYPHQRSTGAIDYLHRLDYYRVDAEEECEGQIVGEQMGRRSGRGARDASVEYKCMNWHVKGSPSRFLSICD